MGQFEAFKGRRQSGASQLATFFVLTFLELTF